MYDPDDYPECEIEEMLKNARAAEKPPTKEQERIYRMNKIAGWLIIAIVLTTIGIFFFNPILVGDILLFLGAIVVLLTLTKIL